MILWFGISNFFQFGNKLSWHFLNWNQIYIVQLSFDILSQKLAEKQIKPKPSTPRRTPTRTQGRSKQGKDKPLQTSEEQGEKNPSRYSRGSCQNEFQVWSGTNNLLPEPDDSGYSTKSSSLSPKLSDPSLKLQSESFGPIFNVDNDEKSR